jgi:ferritin-like metal-binding protein YciE
MKTKKSTNSGRHQNPLEELFLEELKDIYWAEKKLTKAIPKMAKNANNEELVETLENHLQETEHQVERLEKIFSLLDKNAQGKKCEAMEGIIKEGEEVMSEFKDSPALDAAIIAAAQKVEHYEIASYGTLRTYADQLGLHDAVHLLDEILQEEKAADEKLTEIAEGAVNIEAEEEAGAY